jgi:hypothetical protein
MAVILGMVISSTSMGSTDGRVDVAMSGRCAWFGRAKAVFDVVK